MTKETYKQLLDEGIYKIQDGLYPEAIDLINQSIKLKNDWEISYFYRAVAHQAAQNYDEAILDYTKAISINNKMTDAYYNRAKIILEKKNNTEKELNRAVEDLKKAIEGDEKFVDALFAMAAAQKKLKNYHACLEYLEKILQIEPQAIHAKALKKLILQKYIKEIQ